MEVLMWGPYGRMDGASCLLTVLNELIALQLEG